MKIEDRVRSTSVGQGLKVNFDIQLDAQDEETLEKLRGPKGDKGDKGDSVKGDPGKDGKHGDKGDKGDLGDLMAGAIVFWVGDTPRGWKEVPGWTMPSWWPNFWLPAAVPKPIIKG